MSYRLSGIVGHGPALPGSVEHGSALSGMVGHGLALPGIVGLALAALAVTIVGVPWVCFDSGVADMTLCVSFLSSYP